MKNNIIINDRKAETSSHQHWPFQDDLGRVPIKQGTSHDKGAVMQDQYDHQHNNIDLNETKTSIEHNIKKGGGAYISKNSIKIINSQ